MGSVAKNIQVRPEDHERLVSLCGTFTGMSIKGAVTAVLNAWESATDDQQIQAVRRQAEVEAEEASALGDDNATDPRRESIKLSCRAARLVDKVDRALANDNDIDARELRELVDELKGIQHGAERVAQASKKSAKRKGRAA